METDICSKHKTFKFYFVNHPRKLSQCRLKPRAPNLIMKEQLSVLCSTCPNRFSFIFTHTDQMNLIGPQQTCSLNYEHKQTKTK